MEKISHTMKKHHALLEGLLNKVERHQSVDEEYKKMFNGFKWELEKHFFVEERAIFTQLDIPDKEFNENVSKLLKEHSTILKSMASLDEDIKAKNEIDLSEFKKLIRDHKNYEDEEFYPALDNVLDGGKKKEILDRLSNPI